MPSRKSSTQDIADIAGVSRTTVSFVLNDRPNAGISEATREKILRIAADLDYYPNALARSLKRGKTNTFGLIVPSFSMSFYGDIIDAIEKVCAQNSYHCLMASIHNAPEITSEQIHLLLEHRVDGIICLASSLSNVESNSWLTDIYNAGVPCIFVDQKMEMMPLDYVISDDLHGAMTATQHLIALGHQRIAHITAEQTRSTMHDRIQGYRMALHDAKLVIDEDLIVGESFSVESIRETVEQVLAMQHPPTAILAGNDEIAIGVLEVAAQHGLQAPRDLALVGYGDLHFARYLGLTTVQQQPSQMGKIAAERLLQRLDTPHMTPIGIVLPTNLVVRKSSGAVV